jgi:uncharacterized protein YajQ (UPF0234 family)
MPDNSFDVVSQIDLAEVSNALQQAMKEITTRYDLKDSKSSIELNEKDKKLTLASADEYKLKAVTEILGQKLVKRGVPIKNLTYGTIQTASGSTVKQEVTLVSGIPTEKAKDLVKRIKESKLSRLMRRRATARRSMCMSRQASRASSVSKRPARLTRPAASWRFAAMMQRLIMMPFASFLRHAKSPFSI